MKKVCIAIPVYKADMTEVAQASLIQCLTVLGKYGYILIRARKA